MNFCHLPTARHGFQDRRAFTLIELLVVITIIAVLAGLLLPVASKVTQNSYKAQTKGAAVQIVTAVKNYQTDYGSYPNPPSVNGTAPVNGTPSDTTYPISTTVGNAALFNVLRAKNTDTTYNIRKVFYFEGNDAKSATQPKAGFVPYNSPGGAIGNKGTGTTNATVNIGDFLDSWGNEYYIRIDTGSTNAVINPYYAGDETTTSDDTANYQPLSAANNGPNASGQTPCLLLGVIVWTHGSDGMIGTNGTLAVPPASDDVVSWQ